MEAEARAILEAALAAPEEDQTDLATFARTLFASLGGVELELPPREPAHDPPDFEAHAPKEDPTSSASEAPGTGAAARRRPDPGRKTNPETGRGRQ
jgi:hypothetical protein